MGERMAHLVQESHGSYELVGTTGQTSWGEVKAACSGGRVELVSAGLMGWANYAFVYRVRASETDPWSWYFVET